MERAVGLTEYSRSIVCVKQKPTGRQVPPQGIGTARRQQPKSDMSVKAQVRNEALRAHLFIRTVD
jgi:hypothetical protein